MSEEKKVATAVTMVEMTDGRMVAFAGKRKMLKEVFEEGERVYVRFDFANGETRLFRVPDALLLKFAGHGASQKIGDEAAGVPDIDDAIVAVDDLISRLEKGEWGVQRASGDGFAGASVVIRAICEATGKPPVEIKAFLQKKLDDAAAKDQKLTRHELYASFRNPASKTGQIIKRLEEEKASKSSVNADDLLSEL